MEGSLSLTYGDQSLLPTRPGSCGGIAFTLNSLNLNQNDKIDNGVRKAQLNTCSTIFPGSRLALHVLVYSDGEVQTLSYLDNVHVRLSQLDHVDEHCLSARKLTTLNMSANVAF